METPSPDTPTAGIQRPTPSRFTWRHLRTVLVAYVVFGLLALSVWGLADAPKIALGPWFGGTLHEWQSCCTEALWTLAPCAVGAAGAAFLVQLLVPPQSGPQRLVRSITWGLGVSAWFLSAYLSFGHVG